MRNYISLTLLFLWMGNAQGQSRPDSTKIPQVDTTAAIVRIWQLKDDYSRIEDYYLDTMQTSFQVYNPVYRYSISNSYLGNLGLQDRSNIYFDTRRQDRFLFLNPYIPYQVNASDNIYFNVRKPFSRFEYSSTGQNRKKREQLVRIAHTQNINPFLNFGFDLKLGASEGHYTNQKAKLSMVRIFGSYIKGDYAVHGSGAINSFRANENGGITDDNLFIEKKQEPLTYGVNLNDASSFTRDIECQVTQRYRFGSEKEIPDSSTAEGFRRLRERTAKTGSIIHTIEYGRSKRFYEDRISSTESSFYRNYYIDPQASDDSTFSRSLVNTLQVMLDENPNRKNDFGARAFISHELVKYVFNKAPDTSVSENKDTIITSSTERQYNNIYIGASLVHTVGTGWNWNFAGKLYLTGYRAGDMLLTGEIDKFIHSKKGQTKITLAGSLELAEPDYFLQHYASNHFQWENDFNKTKEIVASFGMLNEPYKMEVNGHLSAINDYVYFGKDTLPAQFHPVISIFSADIKKYFKLGPFNSIHKLVYQLPTNKDIIRIPDISYYTSNFFGFLLFKKVLSLEIGFDLFYYTRYRGYAFMPSYGLFYHQDERKLGNYPYVDVFITVKLQRTRIFIKYDHVNDGLLTRDYFNVLHYPMPERAFKFGFSWNFYD